MRPKIRNKFVRRCLWILTAVFILMNALAIIHAYSFTHFSESRKEKTKAPEHLGFGQKCAVLLFGIDNPRPKNTDVPKQSYKTIHLKGKEEIECWQIRRENSRGTIILLHGYSGQKSSMLDKSDIFLKLGYNTLLVDFMGSGGSEGNQTTLGYYEAEQVKRCFDYLKENGEQHIYLFGTSMGAVAAMKAINDYHLNPETLIIECPFGTMYKTVSARFKSMGVPSFPMSGLLTFWGGVINDFNAFRHNPEEYAENINCPTLLLHGVKDQRVSMEEIRAIYANLKGKKTLKLYQNAGHENYLNDYEDEWTYDISKFLNSK